MLDTLFVKKKEGLLKSQLNSTKWTKAVMNGQVDTLYPRPNMVRNSFIDLNGMWNYSIVNDKDPKPSFEESIRVPFSPEAPLSGVNRQLNPGEKLIYRKDLHLPSHQEGHHYRLNLGAVDQIATVFVNGEMLGKHLGGYLPFSIDIPAKYSDETIKLEIHVTDDSDKSYHTRGKQKLNRGGMFYTAQSGIWQTVWLEEVPDFYIKSVKIKPCLEEGKVLWTAEFSTKPSENLNILAYVRDEISEDIESRDSGVISTQETLEGDRVVVYKTGEKLCELPLLGKSTALNNREISLSKIQPWTPQDPHLYHFVLKAGLDEVHCYFGLRDISIKKDSQGFPRFHLNGEPLNQSGLLDQGYWPDGLYTAPCDEALIYDIELARESGFNMLRKHMKIEPQRFYYHCDRLGMLVWQDMPSGGGGIKQWFVTYLATLLNRSPIKISDTNAFNLHFLSRNNKEGRAEFFNEIDETIKALYNHPSIVVWVPFNEGWGQFQANKITDQMKLWDPTRPVDHASGWFDQGGGDFKSLHHYFFKFKYASDPNRALVLSEYGGYTYKILDHSYSQGHYGYGSYKNKEDLSKAFEKLILETVLPSKKAGMCAFVYTQLSDIEDEVNGIITYDREEIKFDMETLRRFNQALISEENK